MFTIVPHWQIMAQLDSKDSSRNLHANCIIGFLFCLHLILRTCVQTFDVMFFVNFIFESIYLVAYLSYLYALLFFWKDL